MNLSMVRFARQRDEVRYCSVCQKSAKRFVPHGTPAREEARCGHCGALERHRMTWSYFERRSNLFLGRGTTMLHVAPERQFEPLLRKRLGSGYLTAPMCQPRPGSASGGTGLPYEDDSFDVVYCGHLRARDDDAHAMRELRRVMKPTGWAALLVPATAAGTERPIQDGDVPRSGPEFPERLRSAGFTVDVVEPQDFLSGSELATMRIGLDLQQQIFLCTK